MKSNKLKIILYALTIMGLIYAGILQYKIYQYSNMKVPNQVDYIIILGARVKGEEPSLVLQYRINKAAEYLKQNSNTVAIASGGKGPGEDISEAESIKRELIKQGIKEDRILIEDHSTNTRQNIQYSKKLILENAQAGLIVTNDFHMYRARLIAKDQKLKAEGLPAKTPPSIILQSHIREYLAITKQYLTF